MTNISQIMKQAKAMQEKMAEVQKKVEEAEVQGSSGGNSVVVTMNGKHELKKIKIEPNLLDKNEVEVLEDLIVAAMNDATKKISENMSSELGFHVFGYGFTSWNEVAFLN